MIWVPVILFSVVGLVAAVVFGLKWPVILPQKAELYPAEHDDGSEDFR